MPSLVANDTARAVGGGSNPPSRVCDILRCYCVRPNPGLYRSFGFKTSLPPLLKSQELQQNGPEFPGLLHWYSLRFIGFLAILHRFVL